MVSVCCAVYDNAIAAFGSPFFCKTTAEAVRMFGDAVRSGPKDSPMTAHPKDFQLFEVGAFDSDAGRLVALDVPRRLVDAVSLVSEVSNGGS